MSALTRRGLLLAGAAALPLVAGGRPWRTLVEVARPGSDAVRLASLPGDRRAAAAVGRALLAAAPAEADELAAAVAASLTGGARALPRCRDAQLRALLAARVRRDFREREVVAVDGWVLSRTEARLCALVALRPTARAS